MDTASALYTALLLLVVLCGSENAFAKIVAGPRIVHEQAAPAKVRPIDEDDPAPDLEMARRRTSANLLLPLPVNFLGGMLVAKADWAEEAREFSGDDLPDSLPNDVKHPNVLAMGGVYLPHAKEGAPRFLVVASRYGDANLKNSVRPMGEFILGADIDARDMPFKLRLDKTDEAETRLLVRYRNYPGFSRWLLYAGHSIYTQEGWIFELHIPSHLTIGWRTEDRSKVYFFDARADSRDYPVKVGDRRGWYTGHVKQVGLGIRQRLIGPLFFGLEVGLQNETMELIDEEGETLSDYTTGFSPWGRLSLETWIDTTKPI